MAQTGGYREELENESKHTDPNSHASRLIAQEIERLKKGEDEVPEKKGTVAPFLDLHTERQQKVAVKIRLPIKEFPKYNFVGKLLGPKGTTLKALQEQTGCRMAIMGRGSMRDQNKEEELRKEGGKYAHLEEELHVLVECFAELTDGYHRLGVAFEELKKFIIPQMQGEFEGGEMGMNGSGRGRGSFRGGPPERGGRGGSFRGGRGAGPPPPSGRGGPGGPPSSRGGPRGAPRGGAPPPSRGGGRGAAPPSNSSYEGYGSHSQGGYNSGGYDSGYDAYGGQNYSSGGDSQYYDYGHSSGQGSGYDNYSGGYDYGDSWNTGSGKAAAQSGRGSSRGGQARSHPYQRS